MLGALALNKRDLTATKLERDKLRTENSDLRTSHATHDSRMNIIQVELFKLMDNIQELESRIDHLKAHGGKEKKASDEERIQMLAVLRSAYCKRPFCQGGQALLA